MTIDAREKALKYVFCIYYPIQFKSANEIQVQVLVDLKSEINAIYLTFVKKPGLSIRSLKIETQKIDGTILDTYSMVVTVFSITNNANQVKFFEEIFLVANVSLKVVFGIFFPTLSGANINFLNQELW